jgi:molybdate transport system substrate-binding protein
MVHAQDSGPTKLADASPSDVRIFASGSLRASVLAMRGRLEKATGRRIVVESSESRILQREIEAGQGFEAALLTTTVIKDLVATGKIVAGSETRVGAVRVGVSVRGDAPRMDVTTAVGLKSAIVGAHSIRRYYGVGASVPVLDNLFTKLGLLAVTQDRMVHLGGEQIVPEEPLPRGQYELIINLISAIRPMKGWTYLGPIPEQFQMPVGHTAGLGAAGNLTLGRQVMAVIKGPEFQATLRADGITSE